MVSRIYKPVPLTLPLIDAYEMRNALAHGYFKVDLKIVWLTVQCHLPALFDALVLIKAKL
jgi:uncharacterized protein with HEPN domain